MKEDAVRVPLQTLRSVQFRLAGALFAAGVLLLLAVPASAQTFTVLHEFTGGADGSIPESTLVEDRAGNLYGLATFGANSNCHPSGSAGCGAVFKLTHKAGGWAFSPLYAFTGEPDGANPVGSLTIAPDGTLYGVTNDGGVAGNCLDSFGQNGCGTVFHLQPLPTICAAFLCPWRETVLYRFTGGDDGNDPWAGVTLDRAGNLYGTAHQGGANNWGVAYELLPSGSGWTQATIHAFAGGSDGANPTSPLAFDPIGNLYGTTPGGGGGGNCYGGGCGTVFELLPVGEGWSENILYRFAGSDFNIPYGGVVLDPAGNLYGTVVDGINGVFELSYSNGNWNLSQLYSHDFGGEPALYSPLARDAAGNLYGTAEFGGNDQCDFSNGCGFVFKLAPSGDGWIFTQLYAFNNGADGAFPYGGVVVDAQGNIYGTAAGGGTHNCGNIGCGTVWEITP